MQDMREVRYEYEIPLVMESLVIVHEVMRNYKFDERIHHLVQVRVSQINRCGFSMKIHSRETLENSEPGGHLPGVEVWSEVDIFSEKEKAALEWAEALTLLDSGQDLSLLKARLCQFFTETEICGLTTTVAMANLWNRINISR